MWPFSFGLIYLCLVLLHLFITFIIENNLTYFPAPCYYRLFMNSVQRSSQSESICRLESHPRASHPVWDALIENAPAPCPRIFRDINWKSAPCRATTKQLLPSIPFLWRAAGSSTATEPGSFTASRNGIHTAPHWCPQSPGEGDVKDGDGRAQPAPFTSMATTLRTRKPGVTLAWKQHPPSFHATLLTCG